MTDPDAPRCRFGFRPDDIVTTPRGKRARLVSLRSDEHWDALYLDEYDHLAGTILWPAMLHLETKPEKNNAN